jgi:hypothetical protein
VAIGISAAPYAKFVKAGDRHGGEIVDFRVVQTTDFDSRRPQYLESDDEGKFSRVFNPFRASDGKPNDPICQWEITVDTGVEDENGDTERRIFVDPRKGRRNTLLEGKRGGDAVALALKKAKCHRVGLEIGGSFYLTAGEKVRDGSGPATNTWSAEYTPPAGGPGTGKPVDEIPHLVGGGRYDKVAELAKWESTQGTALQASIAAAQQKAPTHAEPVAAAPRAEIPGLANHASSTVLNGSPTTTVADAGECPF